MKKVLGLIAIVALFLSSCDIIEGPYLEQDPTIDITVEFPELNKDSVIRKVLVEEFTGHYCTNCPERGHRVLESLSEKYGDMLVPVAIHAGGLAAPREEPYTYDFRTEVGNELYTDFEIKAVPCASVNRVKKGNDWVSYNSKEWDNLITNVNKDQIVAGIQLINEYKEDKRVLLAHSKTTMLKEYANPIMISVYLIEDEFVSPQLDGGNLIMDYKHHHVLRGSLNGTYGSYLSNNSGMVEKDSAYTKSYQIDFNKLSQTINYKNCRIVTFIYDATTKEVLQVETRKVVED